MTVGYLPTGSPGTVGAGKAAWRRRSVEMIKWTGVRQARKSERGAGFTDEIACTKPQRWETMGAGGLAGSTCSLLGIGPGHSQAGESWVWTLGLVIGPLLRAAGTWSWEDFQRWPFFSHSPDDLRCFWGSTPHSYCYKFKHFQLNS